MGPPSPSGCRFRRRYRMYKVIVVEDETMVRRGIILTIDWAALDLSLIHISEPTRH